MKKKFVLEFDEEPALVFVQHKAGDINEADIWQDGVRVLDWRKVEINAGVEEFTTHKIEYLTGGAKGFRQPSEFSEKKDVGNLNVTINTAELTAKAVDDIASSIDAGLRKAQRHQQPSTD